MEICKSTFWQRERVSGYPTWGGISVFVKLRDDAVTTTVSHVCSHTYLPIKDSNTAMLFSTHRISVHDTGFRSEGLEQYSKCEGLTQRQQTRQMQIQEDTAIGLSFGPRRKALTTVHQQTRSDGSKSPFSVTGHATESDDGGGPIPQFHANGWDLLSTAFSAYLLATRMVLLRATGLTPKGEEDRRKGAPDTAHLPPNTSLVCCLSGARTSVMWSASKGKLPLTLSHRCGRQQQHTTL